MKIKVGDELTIKSKFSKRTITYFSGYERVAHLIGKKVKVVEVGDNGVQIDIDEGLHYWDLVMFEEFDVWLEDVLDKHVQWLKKEKGGECANFSGVNLSYVDLSFTDLRKADLHDANLYMADLYGADLYKANLSSVNFFMADLRYADFNNADLSYSNLSYSDLKYSNLNDANLSNADLYMSDLNCASLHGANLSNADLDCIELYKTLLYNTKMCDNDGHEIEVEKFMHITPIGSRKDETQIIITKDNKILIKCGCFFDYIDKFEEAVHEEHKGNKFEKQYMIVIELAKAMLEG